MKRAVFGALLVAAAAPAAACEPSPAEPVTATLIAACNADLAESEGELAKAYRRVRAQTPMELRPRLAKAQQAWLGYRAAQCGFESGTATTAKVAGVACAVRMNRERAGTLEDGLARD